MTLALAWPVAASAETPPYGFPVVLPAAKQSPAVDANAPYTPVVLDLIHQLEPSNPPTRDEIANASKLLHDGPSGACHNVGPVSAPTGTDPSIAPICWTDAQGVLNTSGPNARGSTAPTTLMGLASSFDLGLANAWGQTEGSESRAFMVTGMFGPQTDLDRLPNWGRNLTTGGEDPYLSGRMVAAQIHGMQGAGAMSEMKHFAVYNGQSQNVPTDIGDQALHENYLTPYEFGFVDARAAATMCSYQIFRDTSTHLPANVSSLTQDSPFAAGALIPPTWDLNESHYACENPTILNYVLRDLWHSKALVGSDYPATHSTSGILQGEDQEMPTQTGFFSGSNTLTANQQTDATGSTCADSAGSRVDCSAPGALHVGGIPGPGCPAYGCTLVDAVMNGTIPLAVFNQSLARILYQEQRFGILGCDQTPVSPLCTNPGGIGSNRTGTANLPLGASGTLATKYGDAAIVEKMSESAATLLKNDGGALPLDASSGDILVTGANANHTVADPTNEASTGYIDRDAVNPLQQLKEFSGRPGAFTYAPANDPTGRPVPPTALATAADPSALGGLKLSVDGGAPAQDATAIDHTAVNGNRLAPGHTYTWSGYLWVPTTDTYTFAIQQSPTLRTTLNCPQTGQNGTPVSDPPALTLCSAFTAGNAAQTNDKPDAVSFTLDGAKLNLNATTANIYGATVPSNPTTAGFTDQGLISRTCATGNAATEPGTTNCGAAQSALTGGTWHSIQLTVNNATDCVSTPPAAAGNQGNPPAVAAVPADCVPASFRFAYTRASGDIADAAAAAVGKQAAVVFVNDGVGATSSTTADGATISAPVSLSPASSDLINAVAAANPHTIVVMDTANPVLMPWFENPKSVLEMWFAGQEGGTATARLLLGLATPGGHSSLTWPKTDTDTIWGYDEPAGALYPGSSGGRHPERLNGNGGCTPAAACPPTPGTLESEGIYNGYRYFDKLGITPRIPFGYGLSYTSFAFSNLTLTPKLDGTVDVGFDVKNTGARAGDEVAQVYVGPGPEHPGIQQAVRALRGFDRVSLDAGQTKHEVINLDRRSFEYWDETTQQWLTNYGARTIYVGDADAPASLPLSAAVTPLSSAASGTVSGTVPATLSLTLGTPATFAPFTAGVGQSYLASTSATVTSTAGDGRLSVADPSSTATGHLVNGAFSLPQPLEAKASSPAGTGSDYAAVGGSANPTSLLTYSGPASNDQVAIGFRQTIGANDALRTGTYSKTLTFTLSTTQP